MKAIVVYYSLEGNTQYVADTIAKELGAETLRLNPKKTYPKAGFRKFVWGGMSAVMAETPELEPYLFDADDYELVIIGFPVWASNVAPPIRTFVKENDLSGARIAAFACQAGNGAEKAFAKLEDCLGGNKLKAKAILIDPKAKPTSENEQKLKEFCSVVAQ